MNQKVKDKIKQAWEENPILVIGVGAAAIKAVAALIDANTRRVNAHAWAIEVDRRNRMSRR